MTVPANRSGCSGAIGGGTFPERTTTFALASIP
jgi:hypothetical protein